MKCHTLTNNFARLQNFFLHLNFSLPRKQLYEQKTTFFWIHFSPTKSLPIFSHVSFPASKFTPVKVIKKGLLQYSSSSRKKDSAPIQFKFFEL